MHVQHKAHMKILGAFLIALPFIAAIGILASIDWRAMLIAVSITLAVILSVTGGLYLMSL